MKKPVLVLTCIVTLFVTIARAQTQDENYAKGLHLYFIGYYNFAAQAFTESLKKNPDQPYAHLYRGNCYAFLHRFKEAKKDFAAARPSLSDNADLCFGYGYMYNEMKQYKKAIPWLDKAILKKPGYALAYNTRGVSYLNTGKPKIAIENFTEAIRLDSGLAVAYNNRGTAIYENQDIASATNFDIKTCIKDFDKAIQLSPSFCLAKRNRGLAYSFLKKYELALPDLNDAIKCNDTNALYYINRGTIYTEIGVYDRAISDFEQAQHYDPGNAEILILKGETQNKAGDVQSAVLDEMKAAIMDKRYKALSNYNISRFYAISKEKTLMLKYLKLARRYGYFRPKNNLADFLKNDEFLPYKDDPGFSRLRKSIRGHRM